MTDSTTWYHFLTSGVRLDWNSKVYHSSNYLDYVDVFICVAKRPLNHRVVFPICCGVQNGHESRSARDGKIHRDYH